MTENNSTRKSNVFDALSYKIADSEFIDRLCCNVLYNTDARFLFVLESAVKCGLFKDPSVIDNRTIRSFLFNASNLRSRGMDSTEIREVLSKNAGLRSLVEKYSDIVEKNKKIDFRYDMFMSDILKDRLRSFYTINTVKEMAEVINSAISSADDDKLYGGIYYKLGDILRKYNEDFNFDSAFKEMILGDLEERIKYRASRMNSEMKQYITSGLPILDDNLSGGLEKGRLTLPCSLPGAGKSTFCINTAVKAFEQHACVYFITLENSIEETFSRIDSRISGIGMNNLANLSDQVREKVNKFCGLSKGFMVVKEFPANSVTVPTIKNYILQRMGQQNYPKPDIVFVDYLDLVRPVDSYGQRRFELSSVTRDLKRLSQELSCNVVSPTQLNRAAAAEDSNMSAGMQNLSEDFGKAMVADLLLVFRQTQKDIESNILKIFVAKSRYSRSRFTVLCNVDFPTQVITPIRILTQDEEDKNNVSFSNSGGLMSGSISGMDEISSESEIELGN